MKESGTYADFQALFLRTKMAGRNAGVFEEARMVLLLLGRRQFGEPTREVMEAINAEYVLHRLHEWILELKDAASWEELLERLAPSRAWARRKVAR